MQILWFCELRYTQNQVNTYISKQPENFELETNTVWAFPNRGKWATHDAKYRGNWSPYIPRNVILRYFNGRYS